MGKLELTLTDLLQVSASLNEGLVLCKYSVVLVELPRVLVSGLGVGLDHVLVSGADNLPLLAALDALIEILHALFDVVS